MPCRKTEIFGESSGMFPASIDGLYHLLATVSQEIRTTFLIQIHIERL
jgi:hypothetical protein